MSLAGPGRAPWRCWLCIAVWVGFACMPMGARAQDPAAGATVVLDGKGVGLARIADCDLLAEGGDWIDVRGVRKHIQGYLKEFLFDPAVVDSKVGMLSGGERSTTNNRMELTAVIEGFKALKRPCDVTLYTDSKYVADAITKGWAEGWKRKGWKCWGLPATAT